MTTLRPEAGFRVFLLDPPERGVENVAGAA
jgi:hypothetical protein